MGIIDDLTKSPGLIAVLGLAVLAIVFRDKISNFASAASGGAETVSNLGETGNILSGNLLGSLEGLQGIAKGITDFKFPTFEFPKIEIPDFNFDFGLDTLFKTQPIERGSDITETPAAEGRASNRGRDVFTQTRDQAQREVENFNVQTQFPGQTFTGGGPSFIGGSVSETPITGQSTLSFIIDKLGVSASKAASIRAGFRDDFGDFDFGTNTGSGQTSGGFEGLTPEQIALRLTGGNISNF